jgi:hypothetical protein
MEQGTNCLIVAIEHNPAELKETWNISAKQWPWNSDKRKHLEHAPAASSSYKGLTQCQGIGNISVKLSSVALAAQIRVNLWKEGRAPCQAWKKSSQPAIFYCSYEWPNYVVSQYFHILKLQGGFLWEPTSVLGQCFSLKFFPSLLKSIVFTYCILF